MGGEREPVMCAALLSIITGILGVVEGAWLSALFALFFYAIVVWLFRRMAVADPDMSKVWRRYARYQSCYPARSSYWASMGYRP